MCCVSANAPPATPTGITAMGKGKKKTGGAASGAGGIRDQKAVRAAVETIVNDAVKLQVRCDP